LKAHLLSSSTCLTEVQIMSRDEWLTQQWSRRTRACNPRRRRTMQQWDNGTMATGDNRTVGQWTHGQWTVGQQDKGQWDSEQCDYGALGHLTMGHWDTWIGQWTLRKWTAEQ
jgi:hypothetical protein